MKKRLYRVTKGTGDRLLDRDVDNIYRRLRDIEKGTEERYTPVDVDLPVQPVQIVMNTSPETMNDVDGITVRKNGAGEVGPRKRLNVVEGSNVTISTADDGEEIDITISATGGSGTPSNTVTDVSATPSAGSATTYSRGDHTHRGVRSIKRSGGSPYYGDVTLYSADPLFWTNETDGVRVGIDLTGSGGSGTGDGISIVGLATWIRSIPTYNAPGWTVISADEWERVAFVLPANCFAHAVAWEVLTPFAGPGLTNLWLTFHDNINTGHTIQIDLTSTGTRGTAGVGSATPTTNMHSGNRNFAVNFNTSLNQRIRIKANPAGWNLNNLTQGAVKLYLLISRVW